MQDLKVVGKATKRQDLLGKVTGATKFGADVNPSGQLHAAVYRSPIPHGIIKKIDTSRAAAMNGVRAIATGEDAPYRFGRFIFDQPFLAIGRVRYVGEPVVAIAADTLEMAREAVQFVDVEFEELPVVSDLMEAIKPESPLLHETWSQFKIIPGAYPEEGTNICDHARLRKGDIEKGFAEADVIVEHEYYTAMTSHAVLEAHVATALVDQTGKITVWTPTQSPFYQRSLLASAMGIPEHMLRIVVTTVGGAFGGKLEARAEPIAIALARKTRGRPVKVAFSRTDDFLAGVVRAPVLFRLKTGVKKDGTLTAFEAAAWWDTGAYAGMGPRVNTKATVIVTGPYEIPNIKSDGYTVVTNKQLGSAYRGFGVPEATYAQEAQMDAVARAIDMDPVALRLKNVLEDGKLGPTGEVMFTMGARECIERAAETLNWDSGPLQWKTEDGKIHGKGMGAFLKSTGTPSYSSTTLKLNLDGTITIAQGGTELGQGVNTVMPMIVSEELAIPISKINMAQVDTETVPPDKTTTSSRLTFHMGNAMLLATKDLKKKLYELAADAWKVEASEVEIKDGFLTATGRDDKRINMAEIGKSGLLKSGPPIVGIGSFETSPYCSTPDVETGQTDRLTIMWFVGATGVEVEIDPDTGKVKVTRVAAANDVGKVINPVGCLQQIEGGVNMGIGNTLLEEMIYRDGRLMNGNLVDFKVPTSMDSEVEITPILVETTHPDGPYGAKGLGEPAMCSVQAGIVSAVSHALGEPIDKVPIKPEHIIEICKKKGWR